MIRKSAMTLATMLVAATTASAFAVTRDSINIWGNNLDLSPFETHQMSVAVARDTRTGRQFNVVKLPSGKMMALYSVDKLETIGPFADDSEMMYGNHRGSPGR